MLKLTYKLSHPIRLLLPVSATFLSLPWIFKTELMNFYSFPIFYFFGTYLFFVNFPKLSQKFHEKPLYIEDLVLNIESEDGDINDYSVIQLYNVIMNCILSILFSVFAEYLIIQDIKSKSIIEICGVIGGNLSLYMKAQNTIGNILLEVCHTLKEERKRTLSEV